MENNTPNRIKNPETPVPKTPQMNDRDFLNDALTTEKYISSSYSTALKEASHESLYRTIASVSQETDDCHRNLYNLMFKNGWYGLEKETPQTIQQSVQQFSNYMQSQDPYRGNLIQ